MNYVAIGILQAVCVLAGIALALELLGAIFRRGPAAPREDTPQEKRLAEIRAQWAQPLPSWQEECEAQRQEALRKQM